MSKKLIISFSIAFSVIAVILILFWTLFALSSVSVQFHSTTKNLTLTNQEIVEAGEFRYGACVLFEGKKKTIEKIEAKAEENSNFAYLRVLNIETVFPNKFVVHVAEREELFAVEYNGQVLYCDRDLKVLKIVSEFLSTEENPILLQGLVLNNEQIKIGQKLTVKQDAIKNFYGAMLQNNRNLSQQLGKFEKIELSNYIDVFNKRTFTAMTMTSFQGRKYIINNLDFAFANKIQKMFSTESVLFSQKTDENGNILNNKNEILYVAKAESGEYVAFDSTAHTQEQKQALTYALLDRCAIKVDNLSFSDYVDRTENDIYYSLVALD